MSKRGLFQVHIVDPELDTVVNKLEIIASDEIRAQMMAVQRSQLEKSVDEYDFIVVRLGSVREKRKPQEVVVVGE